MEITKFLNEKYNDAALYILYRNTASYVDGLKNAARKVVYITRKVGVKTPVKVSALGSKIVEDAQYLHGDAINGVITTMSRNYCGANSLPIMEGVGSFGTRFSNEASAPRYIFVKQTDYFDLIFKKEDEINLVKQEFEGKEIEPIFYVPTLPLILLNGSHGVGVGFASDVHPRSIENVIKMTRAAIDKKPLKEEWFVPSWKGFKGTVEKGVDKKGNDTWVIKGKAELSGRKLIVDEIPITWDLQSYLKNLNNLKEKGVIQKYNDYSEDDNFSFELYLTEEECKKAIDIIWKDCGLITTYAENLTCMDETNQVKDDYKNVKEIFKDYYNIKIKYLKLRIKSNIAKLTKEEKELKETFEYIQEVVKGTIVLNGKKKSEVENTLVKKGYTIIEKLLSLPMYSITTDKVKEIEKKWKDKIKERQEMEHTDPETLWKKDIDELEAELKKEGLLEGNKKNGKK